MWECKCKCGNIKIVSTNDLTSGNVKSCGCLKRSYGENIIKNLLEKNNILFKQEFVFADLISSRGGYPRYDFAILDKKGTVVHLIEFDGE